MLSNSNYVSVPEEIKGGKFLNKYALTAVTSGNIKLRVNSVHQVTKN
jgi:hypothetical protein